LTQIITLLSKDVERVCQMDFGGESPTESRIREFDSLAKGFFTMKTTLSTETMTLAEAKLKLTKIVETGMALSTEKDSNALCQKILDTAKELTDADGGTLYLLNPSGKQLDFNIMLNDTLGTRSGGTSDKPIPPGLKVNLFSDDGSENHHNVASHAFLTGETINITNAYTDQRFDFSGTKKFDEANGYQSKSFLTVPLKPLGGEILGALQLINARRTGYFTRDMQDFVVALSASAATALYNKQLTEDLERALEDQKNLFQAIVDIINKAIGRKSPYTGGHCDRVPIIAEALAKVTSEVESGPLAGFHLDQNQFDEFILAAKLHDVGKVTIPEYVVDKSTKLETIYNRIHEIRTRFEVLYRDAMILRHESVIAGRTNPDEADRILAETKSALDDEWEFLAKTNLGGEFLPPDKIERIKAIGSRTWLRYFDDRLGLSWEEEFRLAHVAGLGAGKPSLPVEETLLADKPIHIFPRTKPFHEEYKKMENGVEVPYHFQTPVPEVLYNQGEVYNLSISRGTLTNEEHFKIKEHVMQSIFMLDRLPWPKGLTKVSEIAGQHHETLVGSGYPYQCKAEDLSIQSRILTVADIFEALTASDRPYKKPKLLSEAVQVLYFFKKDKHIDADLFDLFLTSGVYLDYAKVHLRPDQIDTVDIQQYLGPVG
jgi:HD-GYP domain-containing protein (c-di-GMP phosphodiesterase class II)